jgi:hypothetical protein
LRGAMDRVEISARTVVGACSDQGMLREDMGAVHDLARYDPVNVIALRRNVADRLLATGCYTF